MLKHELNLPVWPFSWRHLSPLCIFSKTALVAFSQTMHKRLVSWRHYPNSEFPFLNPNYRHLPSILLRVRITGDHSIYSTSFLYQIPSQRLKLFSLLKAFMLNTSTVRRLIRGTQKDICFNVYLPFSQYSVWKTFRIDTYVFRRMFTVDERNWIRFKL